MDEAALSATLRRYACERCFSRKYKFKKCDKILPKCSSCVSHGAECESRIRHFDNYDETVTIKKATLFQYVDSLKHKIEDLEQADANSPSKRQRVTSSIVEDGRIEGRPAPVSEVNTSTGISTPPQNHHCLSVREAMGGIDFLSRSAMAEACVRPDNLPRNMSLHNMVLAALALTSPDPSTANIPQRRKLLNNASSRSGIEHIRLDRESTISYMEIFTDHVCMRYPHLEVQTAMEQYEPVVSADANLNSGSIHDGSIKDNTVQRFNTWLAVAIGALLSQDASMLTSFIRDLHNAAVGGLEAIFEKEDNICVIRCLILLAIFSLYSPSGGSAWHLTGLVVQRCVFLGLDKEADPNGETGPSVLLERRKLFWSAFILDQSLCRALGRPLSLRYEDVNVEMTEDIQPNPTTEIAFKQHLINQARLSDGIAAAGQPPTLLSDYHNICFWEEGITVFKHRSGVPVVSLSYMDQLKCRMMVRLMKSLLADQRASSSNQVFLYRIKSDIMTSCKVFIHCRYKQSEKASIRNSFIDEIDIFYAGISFAYLSYERLKNLGRTESAYAAAELLQECSLLLSTGGGEFCTTRLFQKATMAISRRFMANPLNFAHLCTDDSALYELEEMIPSYILKMVKQCLP